MRLTAFWIKFKRIDSPTPLNLGCGVTAYSQQDAVELVKRSLVEHYGLESLPEIDQITEGISVTDLDQNHVVPNMGNVLVRGVWFPKLTSY